MAVAFLKTIPLLRIFSVEKAKEFYVDSLGFSLDWEHHFEDNTPAYIQGLREVVLIGGHEQQTLGLLHFDQVCHAAAQCLLPTSS